jgi:hypothetical protein
MALTSGCVLHGGGGGMGAKVTNVCTSCSRTVTKMAEKTRIVYL